MALLKRISLVHSQQRGFTLLELVTVLVLLGVMSVGISSFIGLATQSFVNVSERDELISSARFSVERLNRELRHALPNSVRVGNRTIAGNELQCIEFVPIKASTVYIDIPVAPESASNTLSVIPFINDDGTAYTCPATCTDSVSVYPLNTSDIYSDQTDNIGKAFGLNSIASISANEWQLTLDGSVIFDADSPTQRLFTIGAPVSYCLEANNLYRYENYDYSISQVVPPISTKQLMAESLADISLAELPFKVSAATLQRNALVNVSLEFLNNDESIVFNHEIHIENVP